MGDVLTAGAMSGASSAANQVANFYLEMAREMFPVVEIDAARRATIVLTKGLEVK
jgi:conjugal transfer pilus assembly protein TraB